MNFFQDLKKYKNYAFYSAIAELKNQVSGSYLGWIWWVLDPLLYMLVYSFMVSQVFGSEVENLFLFVFIGLTVWNFFASTVQSSVGVIRSYRAVLQKTYIPKFILILLLEIMNFIKMGISIAISIGAMIYVRIPITPMILNIIPMTFIYLLLTFGVSLICAHVGVYIKDMSNVVTVLVRLLFYISGVFYTLDRLSTKILTIYNMVCPTGFIIRQFRDAMMYARRANYERMFYWFIIGMVLSIIGLALTYKHENNYMKVL
jgi:ABC-type polysaccharide/polyol phosphate export permease